MDGDSLRLPANRNCYRLSRVSWTLLKLLVILSPHYLVKYRSRSLPIYNNEFILHSPRVGSEIVV